MAIHRRILKNIKEFKEITVPLYSTKNLTGDKNYSHLVDEYTNYALRPITLENIDEVIFREFHRRWKIAGKELDLLMLDAEVASLRFQNPEKFDAIKEFLNLPYFTCWRREASLLYRTSPSNKPAIYVIPTMKPQGVVYEEWITPHPIVLKFPYVFKFMSTLRENINTFEKLMLEYFKNKRNVLILDNERFEIQPTDQKKLSELEVKDREGENGQTLYILTYNIDVIGYLRDLKDIQKRERPNTIVLTISEKTKIGIEESETLNRTETRFLIVNPSSSNQTNV
jgi:hypothetical protein